MRYISELDLFEIDVRVETIPYNKEDPIGVQLVPYKCPGGIGICKKSYIYPPTISVSERDNCKSYVRMVSDLNQGEPGIFVDSKLYCKGNNSIKFIIEDD